MKKNNKGFTLVELIVVMAIMAILVGALAPQVVKYVEKARESKDMQVANTLFTAVQTAIASSESTVPEITSSTLSGISAESADADEITILTAIEKEIASLSGMADDAAVTAKLKSTKGKNAAGIKINYTPATATAGAIISVQIGTLTAVTNN